MKECTKCKRTLELNTDNFHKASRNNDGFAYYCKFCIAEERKGNRVVEIKEEAKKGVEPKIYDNGGIYKVINNVKGAGAASILYKSEFEGEVIYQDNR